MKGLKKNQSKEFYGLGLIILSLLWLVACQTEDSSTTVKTLEPIITIVNTTNIPIVTVNIEEVATETMAPTLTAINSSSLITSTPTPKATFSPEEAEEAKIKAIELYETNGDCQLPCWWGIVPGKTKWQTAQSLLSTLTNQIYIYGKGAESGSDSIYYANLFIDSFGVYSLLEQSYTIKNEVIERIEVGIESTTVLNYKLSSILSTYGEPSEIWLSSYGHDDFGEIPFTVVLFYSEDVMLLKYYTNASLVEVDGLSIVKGCIQDKTVSSMSLWSPEVEFTFAEGVNKTTGVNPSAGYLYRPLEEVTEMTIETFYQTFLDPDTDVCIETPAEIWVNDH